MVVETSLMAQMKGIESHNPKLLTSFTIMAQKSKLDHCVRHIFNLLFNMFQLDLSDLYC